MEYAEHDFRLNQPVEKGSKVTIRSSLDQVYKQSGVKPHELEYPDFPEQVAHIWQWFLELHMDRGFAEQVINYEKIESWARMTCRTPYPFEVDVIKKLDNLYLSIAHGNN